MIIYFISGLGADERVFQKVSLPEQWNIQYVQWITPLSNESLSSYCYRLSKSIDTNENIILIGLSFGGIVAVELNKILKPKLTIIISSIATKYELPPIVQIIAKTKIDKIIPAALLKIPNAITYWLFGIYTLEEKQLLRQTIANTSSQFLKWAIHQIINWKNAERTKNTIHIHGTVDHLLPIKNTKADIQINDGGHLMIYNKSDTMSKLLKEQIQKYWFGYD